MNLLNLIINQSFLHRVSDVKDTLLSYVDVESDYALAVANQMAKNFILIFLAAITVFSLISALLVIVSVYLLFFLPISFPEITHQAVAIYICVSVLVLLALAISVLSVYVSKLQHTFGQYCSHWRS